jgi:hypothetical protein
MADPEEEGIHIENHQQAPCRIQTLACDLVNMSIRRPVERP